MRLALFGGVCLAALALGSVAGLAQERSHSAADEDVITVRAAPLAHVRDEVLQGVTVLERDDVLKVLGQGLGETLDRQPGVSSSAFGAGASRPIIRGLGEDRIRILSNSLAQIDASSVSPDHAVIAEGLEAERIEILRGPAALAYGGNAIGGVVNVLDGVIAERRPDKQFSGRAYGDYTVGLQGGQGAGQAQLSLGPVVLSGQGFRRTSEDYRITGFAFSEDLRTALTAAAFANGEPAPEFAEDRVPNSATDAAAFDFGLSFVGRIFDRQAFAGASFQRNTSVYGIPEAPGLEEEGGDEEEALFPGPFIDLASNRWEARAGIQDVVLFQEIRANLAVVNYGHVEVEPSGEPGTTFSNVGVDARFELAHKPIAGFSGLAGLEIQTQDFSALGEEAFLTPTETHDFAGFIIERFERGAFAAEGGVRYSSVSVDNTGFGERSFDLLSGSLGLSYRPGKSWFLGLTGARTERAPTQVELFSEGPHLATASFDIGNASLEEEQLWSVEGTARYSRERVRLELNSFANFFDGFIAFAPTGEIEDGLPVFAYAQRDARFIGAEVTGAYDWVKRPGLRLSTDASVDLVRAFFEGGGALPRIPPLSTRVGLEGEYSLFGLRLEWERANTQDRTAEFENTTPGFNVFNARLDFKPYKSSPVRFFIDARNLTDEEVRVATSFVNDLLPRPGRTIRFAAVLDF